MRKLISAAALSLAIAGTASAAAFYEPFTYNIGDLHGNVNPGSGTKWYSTATSGTADRVQVTSGNLVYTGLPTPDPASNSASFGGDGRTDRISLGNNYTSGTVYYSLLLKVSDLTGAPSTGATVMGFNNTPQTDATDDTAAQPTVVSGRLLIAPIDANTYRLGASKASSTGSAFVFTPAATPYNLNDTVYVVGKYTFNTTSGTDDTFDMYINPPASSLGDDSQIPASPDLSATLGNDGGQIATFILRQFTAIVPAGITVDELRVDSDWARVTSNLVPEPASLGLLALGSLGLISRRRRA
jgi:PEP-CTERM motif-containing protein